MVKSEDAQPPDAANEAPPPIVEDVPDGGEGQGGAVTIGSIDSVAPSWDQSTTDAVMASIGTRGADWLVEIRQRLRSLSSETDADMQARLHELIGLDESQQEH